MPEIPKLNLSRVIAARELNSPSVRRSLYSSSSGHTPTTAESTTADSLPTPCQHSVAHPAQRADNSQPNTTLADDAPSNLQQRRPSSTGGRTRSYDDEDSSAASELYVPPAYRSVYPSAPGQHSRSNRTMSLYESAPARASFRAADALPPRPFGDFSLETSASLQMFRGELSRCDALLRQVDETMVQQTTQTAAAIPLDPDKGAVASLYHTVRNPRASRGHSASASASRMVHESRGNGMQVPPQPPAVCGSALSKYSSSPGQLEGAADRVKWVDWRGEDGSAEASKPDMPNLTPVLLFQGIPSLTPCYAAGAEEKAVYTSSDVTWMEDLGSKMHLLHCELLEQLTRSASCKHDVDVKARALLRGSQDVAAAVTATFDANSRPRLPFRFHPADSAYHAEVVRVLGAGPTLSPDLSHARPVMGGRAASDEGTLTVVNERMPGAKLWGARRVVSEAALYAMLEAYCNLASVADRRMRVQSLQGDACAAAPTLATQLWSVQGLPAALMQGVSQGSENLKRCALLLLSQLPLAGSHAAMDIAQQHGLVDACASVLVSVRMPPQSKADAARESAQRARRLIGAAALVVHNVAAVGGGQAQLVVAERQELPRALAVAIDQAGDSGVLLSLTGVVYQLSLSRGAARVLNAVGVCDALRRLLSRPLLAESASADEDEEPYVLVAHMALANLAACGTALPQSQGAQSTPLRVVQRIVGVLACAVQGRQLPTAPGLALRVSDVMVVLKAVCACHDTDALRELVGLEASLVDHVARLVADWRDNDGLYADATGSGLATLAMGMDIMAHLGQSQRCLARMQQLGVDGSLARLTADAAAMADTGVRERVMTMLWMLREEGQLLADVLALVTNCDSLRRHAAAAAQALGWSRKQLALRLTGCLQQRAYTPAEALSVADALQGAWAWLGDAMLYDRLARVKVLMLGADRKTLRAYFDQWQSNALHKDRTQSRRLSMMHQAYQAEIATLQASLLDLAGHDLSHDHAQPAASSGALHPLPLPLPGAAAPDAPARVRLGLAARQGGGAGDALHKVARLRLVESVVRHWQRRGLSGAMRTWAMAVATHKRLVLSAGRVLLHWRQRGLHLAFETWHEHAHAQVLGRSLLVRIAQRWLHRCEATAFFSWQSNARQQQRVTRLCRRIVGRWTHRVCAAAFDRWHSWLAELLTRKIEASGSGAPGRVRLGVMTRSFSAQGPVTAGERARASRLRMMERVVLQWQRRELSAGFSAWLHVVRSHARVTASAQRVVRHWLRQTLAHAWEAWRAHALALAHSRALLAKVAVRWLHRELAMSLATWREHAGRQKSLGDICRRVLGHWVHRNTSGAFDRWVAFAAECASHGQQADKALRRWCSRVLACAWLAWRDNALKLRRARVITQRVVGKWANRRLAAGFARWHLFTEEHKLQVRQATSVLSHWIHRVQHQAFDQWHEHAHAAARSRGILRRIGLRWMHRDAAAGFFSWRDNARRSKRAANLTQRVVLHWTHRACASAFDSWLAHCQSRRQAALAQPLSAQVESLQDMLRAKDRARMLLLERFEQRHAAIQSESASKLLRTVCAKILRYWRHRLLADAWDAWMEHHYAERGDGSLAAGTADSGSEALLVQLAATRRRVVRWQLLCLALLLGALALAAAMLVTHAHKVATRCVELDCERWSGRGGALSAGSHSVLGAWGRSARSILALMADLYSHIWSA